MKAEIVRMERLTSSLLPAGKYKGKWSGYVVEIGEGWRLTTNDGVRGVNIPCTVTVDAKGDATVEVNG